MSKYKPVSCDLHSQLELMAMHKSLVSLTIKDSNHSLKGVISDIRILDGAEYLVLDNGAKVRLDAIVSLSEKESS